MNILEINGLRANTDGNEILTGVDLNVRAGEIHVVMGPNGTGKSTLANVIAGHPDFDITTGNLDYCGEKLIGMAPDQRALKGIFMSFQTPVEVPGVNNMYFLRTALNEKRKFQGLEELDAADFLDLVNAVVARLGISNDMVHRQLNVGFSGGEKKRNEILQMLILAPRLSVLDEIDSGLDVDALKQVATGIQMAHTDQNAVILITHYARILEHITPDFVHIMVGGKIVESGDKALAYEIEKSGYAKFT